MKDGLRLTLITPRRHLQLVGGDLVVLPTKSGEMGVMRRHVPAVVSVVPGSLRYRWPAGERGAEESWLYFFASAGFAEVGPDQVTVVVTAAELADRIDVDRARKALERGVERMAAPGATDRDRQHGKHAVRRAKQRIRVAEHYAGRPGASLPSDLGSDSWQ